MTQQALSPDQIPFKMTGAHAKATVLTHLKNLIAMVENDRFQHISGGVEIHRKPETNIVYFELNADLKFTLQKKEAGK